jgi:outer membrane protein
MKLTTRVTMFILISTIIAAPLAGAEEGLTLQKARELALARSATLRSAGLAVDAASLAAQAQGYSALPAVTASAGGSFEYGRVAAGSASSGATAASATMQLSASQPLFDGGKTSDLVKKYGLATEAARETLRSTRVTTLVQADSAFYALLEATASVDAAASDLDAARLRQTLAQAKIDAGILSKSDYLQTQADTAGYETALILARKTLASARSKMASLTGLPASTQFEQIDFASYDALLARLRSLDEVAIDKLAGDVAALAKATSPTLNGYDLSSRQATLALAIAKKSYFPAVAAGVSQNLSYGGSAGLSSAGSISLTASMNLDLWLTRNAVDAASVAAAQAQLAGSQGETDLDLAVVQALYEWLGSAGSISSSAKALDYAQSNYENVLEKFKLSSATVSDLSTAEALVSADKNALIAARYGFLANLSTLSGLAGLEDAGRLVALVP